MPVLKVKKNGIWEEVSGGSSVEIDASLSIEGAAADAKAVGDALAGKQPVGDYATEDYVDSAISAIPTPDVSGQIGAHNTAADAHTDIRDAVAANEAAISVLLNGTDPETIDGVNDLINYVNEHGSEVTGIKEDIQTNTDDITELKNKVGNNTVTEQINAAIDPIYAEIGNINSLLDAINGEVV